MSLSEWEDRSFENLQLIMAQHAKHLSQVLLDDDYYENLMISMPLGFPMPRARTAFALTQLGPRNRDWFERLTSEKAFDQIGRSFFPWWNRNADALCWQRCGELLCWTTLRWHLPENEVARQSYQLALFCFERARELDPATTLPEAEILDIQQLLRGDDISRPASDESETKAGYWRLPMNRQFPGPWQVELPGYFYEDLEVGGNTTVYWHGDRTVRGSSFAMTKESGVAAPEEIVGPVPDDPQQDSLDFVTDDPPGWATIESLTGEDGDYRMLTRRTGATNRLCVTIVCFASDSDRQWAIDTWRSVRCTAGDE